MLTRAPLTKGPPPHPSDWDLHTGNWWLVHKETNPITGTVSVIDGGQATHYGRIIQGFHLSSVNRFSMGIFQVYMRLGSIEKMLFSVANSSTLGFGTMGPFEHGASVQLGRSNLKIFWPPKVNIRRATWTYSTFERTHLVMWGYNLASHGDTDWEAAFGSDEAVGGTEDGFPDT